MSLENVYAYADANGAQRFVAESDLSDLGAWSVATAYLAVSRDTVLYAGARYVAIANSTGKVPLIETAYWSILVLISEGETEDVASGSVVIISVGAGEDIIAAGYGGTHYELRTFEAENGVTVYSTGSTLVLGFAGTAASDDTASNLGAGAGVFAGKVLGDFQFKSLLGAGDIVVYETGSTVVFDYTDTQAGTSLGGQTSVFAAVAEGTHQFRSLVSHNPSVILEQTGSTVEFYGTSVPVLGENYRLDGGWFELLNLTTGDYHPLFMYGNGTEATLAWGAART